MNPDEFYILASKEFVVIQNHATEMRAYDTRVGEFGAHYAGFDPGFGLVEGKYQILEQFLR